MGDFLKKLGQLFIPTPGHAGGEDPMAVQLCSTAVGKWLVRRKVKEEGEKFKMFKVFGGSINLFKYKSVLCSS